MTGVRSLFKVVCPALGMDRTPSKIIERLTDKVRGLECGAEAEQAIVDAFALDRLRFNSDDRSESVLRRTRVSLDSERAVKQFRQEAADLCALVWSVAV